MNDDSSELSLEELLSQEDGFEIIEVKELGSNKLTKKVQVYGELFPITHPFAIHAKLYRESGNPEIRYIHFKRMHDLLWPGTIWHYWTERRFKAHCDDWKTISLAAGASSAKSFDCAKIALLFWLSDPCNNAVVVASTTLDSLTGRIWGYITALRTEMALPLQSKYLRGKPPKILYDDDDTIHGMFAIAAKKGDDAQAISTWIGRHPKKRLMLVLDEGPDLPVSILSAIPNLEGNLPWFQAIVIGNSLSKFDLHGSLSTPKDGWQSIDPLKDLEWLTTQKKGICLFFPCYDSPAIHEENPIIRKKLSQFLITKEKIESAKKEYGEKSDAFYRFILGFWRSDAADDVVISETFLLEFNPGRAGHWAGIHPLHLVAGLDPAFSQGGDQCILRLGILGQELSGKIVLDFKGEELLFRIPILGTPGNPAEAQIANKVLEILNDYRCPLDYLCVDANGQGRALAEVIRLTAQSVLMPIKIYSTKQGARVKNSFDVILKTSFELWDEFPNFIRTDQLRGLDVVTQRQITSRLIEVKNGKRTLESKNDYKRRMGAISPSLARSPDEADSAALCIQAAIIKFGFYPGQRRDLPQVESFSADKYWAFKTNLKMAEEKHEEVKSNGYPSADFSSDINGIPKLDDII